MKVLLAIDDSECSQVATTTVIKHIPVKGTSVSVLHVVKPIWYAGSESLETVEQFEAKHGAAVQRAQQLVARAEHALREAGFEVSSRVADGDPREVIVEQAEKQKADVIVVGTHGRRGWRRLVLGSVSEAVTRYARCSVHIVRRSRKAVAI
jgi:nucleotide-binding universal stress UspA family protein